MYKRRGGGRGPRTTVRPTWLVRALAPIMFEIV